MEISTSIKNKIKILPLALSNKIAAGEVVERPASVAKELIENSIDADASKITLIIKQSGKQLVQVIDDGSGMSVDDLKIAFQRHATSKIASNKDLEQIETLGFRGEALPSIASVSQIEVCSRESNEKIGNLLRLEAGSIVDTKKKACPKGTNISVKNLFYNTPARRNFLKSDSAELQQILFTIKRFFLAYPDISFELVSDDNQLFSLKSANIDERLKDVLSDEIFSALIPLNESLGGIELSGFVSKPDTVRKTRASQFLFLNGRPIQDKSLAHAILQGYSNSISKGEFPIYCLFLEIDPKLVDVNVHPTKLEVRFSNDRSLYYFFMSSLRKLFTEANIIPKLQNDSSEAFLSRFTGETAKPDIAGELRNRNKFMARRGTNQLSLIYFEQKENEGKDQISTDYTARESETRDIDVQFWQIHNCYILSEIKSGIVIIDQHVAHERILFEKIQKILNKGEPSLGQQLLFPQTITMTVEDLLVIKDIKPLLKKIGFGIRTFSGNSIVIDAIPVDVKVGREAQIVLDILDYYKENQDRNFEPFNRLAAAFACKNAIKSGEKLSQAQMHAMVDQLFACDSPYFCPHGRPVIITMDLVEFDRKFKRI